MRLDRDLYYASAYTFNAGPDGTTHVVRMSVLGVTSYVTPERARAFAAELVAAAESAEILRTGDNNAQGR